MNLTTMGMHMSTMMEKRRQLHTILIALKIQHKCWYDARKLFSEGANVMNIFCSVQQKKLGS